MSSNDPKAPENNPAAWATYQQQVQAGDPNAQANYNRAVSEGPDGPTANTQGTPATPEQKKAAGPPLPVSATPEPEPPRLTAKLVTAS